MKHISFFTIALVLGTSLAQAVEDQTRLPAPDAAQMAFKFAKNKVIKKELKLTIKQIKAMADLESDIRQRGRGITFNEQIALMREAGTKLSKILDAKQQTRLRQIMLQGFGPAAFRIEDVVKEVGLTPEQLENISRQLDEFRTRRREISQVARGQRPTPDVIAKLKTMREEAFKQAMDILDKKQRVAYDKMVGAKFDFDPKPKTVTEKSVAKKTVIKKTKSKKAVIKKDKSDNK